VALPTLSRHVASGDAEALKRTLRQSLEIIATLCVPAAVGLALLGVPIIGLVYEHGRFDATDTAAAAEALMAYSIGLAGYAGIKVLAPAFYALDDARTPMRISLLSIAVNLVLNWTFVRLLGLGHVGLALSTSAVALGNCLLLYVALRQRIGPLGDGFGSTLVRIGVAAAVMGGAGYVADGLIAPRLPVGSTLRYAAELSVEIPLCVSVFVVAAWALRLPLPWGQRR
jgi:putative peptidoglycan lipid II flippase